MSRKYREGHWEALQEALKLEKLRSGPAAVYCLGMKMDTPGVFYLGYIVSRTPHREYFTVTNTGFYFRHEVRVPPGPPGSTEGCMVCSSLLRIHMHF